MSLPEGAAYLKENYALPESPAEIQQSIQTLLREFYLREVQPKPGAPEALAFLRCRGIPMALATTSPRMLVQPALERTGLLPLFLRPADLRTRWERKKPPPLTLPSGGPGACSPAGFHAGGGGLALRFADSRRGGLCYNGRV